MTIETIIVTYDVPWKAEPQRLELGVCTSAAAGPGSAAEFWQELSGAICAGTARVTCRRQTTVEEPLVVVPDGS